MKQFRKTVKIFCLPVFVCTVGLFGQAQEEDLSISPGFGLLSWVILKTPPSYLFRAGCFSPRAGTTSAEQGGPVLPGRRWVAYPCGCLTRLTVAARW